MMRWGFNKIIEVSYVILLKFCELIDNGNGKDCSAGGVCLR